MIKGRRLKKFIAKIFMDNILEKVHSHIVLFVIELNGKEGQIFIYLFLGDGLSNFVYENYI